MPLPKILSLSSNPKKFDFSNEFDIVLNTITSMDDTNPNIIRYEPIRDLLEQFYTMKLTNINKLLGKLFRNLNTLMTKHSSTKEYDEVINLDSFYKNAIEAIEELSGIKTYDETFIKKIISSITQVTATAKNENKSIYSNLYCSLLIIHYYPIVILDTIFLNAQTNISRLKTNIPKLKDTYTESINEIVNEINLSDDVLINLRADKVAAAAAKDAELQSARDDAAAKDAELQSAKAAAAAAAAALKAAQEEADALASANDKEVAEATKSAAHSAADAALLAADDAEKACAHIKESIERRIKVINYTDTTSDIQQIKKVIREAYDAIAAAESEAVTAEQNSKKANAAADSIKIAITSKVNIKQAVDAAKVLIDETNNSTRVAIAAARNVRDYIIKIEPPPDRIAAPNKIFGIGGSNTSDDIMVGGAPGDIKNTLTIINDVLDETDKTGSLIKYSTKIFYKALTILSISIGLSIDINSSNIIVNQIKKLVNDEVIEEFTLAAAPPPPPPPATPATPAAPVGVGAPPPPPPATPATPATTLTPAQEIVTSIESIFDSSIDNYPYFGEIIDDIFNNFYNTDEKKLVEKLKRAQIEDTTKKNKLIEVQNNQNYAELAVNNAKKLAEKEHQTAKASADKDLASATDIKDNARIALGAFPSNIANDLERAYTDLARANITKTKAAAAAAAVPPVPQAITQALDDANTAVNAATAAAALVDAAAAAAVTAAAAAAAAGTTFTSNDVTTFTNAITAFTNAKAKVEDVAAATTATDATATNALSKAATATRIAREEAEEAAKGLLSAFAEVKAQANKKSKPITIKNMKSTIDGGILKCFIKILSSSDSPEEPTKKGGQKTQKNRYRGGIRKNMNSIDSFDSIDSDL
jgi:hypothetical protein